MLYIFIFTYEAKTNKVSYHMVDTLLFGPICINNINIDCEGQ